MLVPRGLFCVSTTVESTTDIREIGRLTGAPTYKDNILQLEMVEEDVQ